MAPVVNCYEGRYHLTGQSIRARLRQRPDGGGPLPDGRGSDRDCARVRQPLPDGRGSEGRRPFGRHSSDLELSERLGHGRIRDFVHRFKIFIFSTRKYILALGVAGGCRVKFRELDDPELGGTCAT